MKTNTENPDGEAPTQLLSGRVPPRDSPVPSGLVLERIFEPLRWLMRPDRRALESVSLLTTTTTATEANDTTATRDGNNAMQVVCVDDCSCGFHWGSSRVAQNSSIHARVD